MRRIFKQKGFTLIETILYVAITATIITVLASVIFFFINTRVKTQTITEVNNDVSRIIDIVSKYVRDSDGVNSPVPGDTSVTLELAMSDISKNPTTISFSGGNITIKEGSGNEINLNSEFTVFNSMSFINYSRTDTPDIIQIIIDAEHLNNGGRNEYEFKMSATTSVSVLEYDI